MPTDDTTADDASSGDRRAEDGREEAEPTGTRDDSDPDRRPRPPGTDRGSDRASDESASVRGRRRYEPVGRPRREIPHGGRSGRGRDADSRAPDRDAWSLLDGELRESRAERRPDPARVGPDDADDAEDEAEGDDGVEGDAEDKGDVDVDQSRGGSAGSDPSGADADAGTGEDGTGSSGRRLYLPVGRDPDAERARRRRSGRWPESDRRAERDEHDPAVRSRLRARSPEDAGRTGSDRTADARYPSPDVLPFDDGRRTPEIRSDRETTNRRPERGRGSDPHAHPRDDGGRSDGGRFDEDRSPSAAARPGGARGERERGDDGPYDRWRLLEELESRTGSTGERGRAGRRTE